MGSGRHILRAHYRLCAHNKQQGEKSADNFMSDLVHKAFDRCLYGNTPKLRIISLNVKT